MKPQAEQLSLFAVEDVKCGIWEWRYEKVYFHQRDMWPPNFRCSVCKKFWFHNGECVDWYKYCPNCGAKMDKEKSWKAAEENEREWRKHEQAHMGMDGSRRPDHHP